MTAASFCPARSSSFSSIRLIIASGDLPMSAGRYIGRSSAEHFNANPITSRKTRRRILGKNAIGPVSVCKRKLRDAAAAVFVFLSAATGTRFVAADFRQLPAHRCKVEFHFAVAASSGRSHRWLRTRSMLQRSRSRRSGLFFQEKLRKRSQEILECLQVGGAAEKIVQHFVFNVRHQLDKHVVSFS